ncbi:hypothetical protein KPL76_03785 [Subtercola sp. PAMC28395]|uniref:hypothetical protein n=1 Tax=Subtercola sp. PAMC28395 TaxID=2846775 RepID=UPI001C0DDD84|nr:hypothetical protein [Subtercola sp. PAMC28395]QWT24525.1 hypothetical protein KPL76_03785 [Subtercola sp. PAMC28395]
MPGHVLALDDPQAFLGGLVEAVESVVSREAAQSALTVVRTRSFADRLALRSGSITSISLATRGYIMELTRTGQNYTAETRRVVHGVVVSRRIQTLGEWLQAFAGRVAVLAGVATDASSGPADALRLLGISVSGPLLSVRRENMLPDLRTLPFKVRGLIPEEASLALDRIVELLLDTLPRVVAGFELKTNAERTATVYLPETLQAYLALPTDWARTHVYADGSTPESALASQLAMLEQAASQMHDAALRGDADVLLVNGRFLTYKFGDLN